MEIATNPPTMGDVFDALWEDSMERLWKLPPAMRQRYFVLFSQVIHDREEGAFMKSYITLIALEQRVQTTFQALDKPALP